MTGVFPAPAIRDVERLEDRDTVNGHTLCGNCTRGLRRAVAQQGRVKLCAPDRAAMEARANWDRRGP